MYQRGHQVGGYEVLDLLGAGGMGQVYRVRNLISDRIEAMKVILADLESEPEVAQRFLREIKVHARLKHNNIASLHTAFEADGRLIMVLELLEGETLAKRLDRSRLPLDQALDYCEQSLAALTYSHAQGVIHRDLKPANIFLTSDGGLKLMDFGIARTSSERTLTKKGALIGSLHHMSPEQIQGHGIDARSDLYSMGVVLYNMATGRHAFNGDSEFAIMQAHLNDMPVPPSAIDSAIPQTLSEIILRTLSKEPEDRFQSAPEFRAAIGEARSRLDRRGRRMQPIPDTDRRVMSAPNPGDFGAGPVETTIGSGAPRPLASRPPALMPLEPVRRAASAPPKAAVRGLGWIVGAALALFLIVMAATVIPRWTKPDVGGNESAPKPSVSLAESKVEIGTATTPVAPLESPTPTPRAPAPPVSPRPVSSPAPEAPTPVETPPRDPAPAVPATSSEPAPIAPPVSTTPSPARAADAGSDRVYSQREVDQTPKDVQRVHPQYTPEAAQRRLEGSVRLEADVWPDGTARNIRVATSIGDAGLDQNAVAALSQWRFAPAVKDGVAVKCVVVVDMTFRMRGR